MIKSFILFVLIASSSVFEANAQSFHLTDRHQDFTPIETFYRIADSIKLNGTVSADLWQSYFDIPVIQLFGHNPSFDSTKFVNDTKSIFAKDAKQDSGEMTDQQKLLLAYKINEQLVKKTIAQMKTERINDSIKVLLFPYLNPALRKDSIIPKQLYMVLEEGNGGLPGYVFNSMLQTAKLKNFKVGAIAAHESFHSIVGSIFQGNFNKYSGLNDFQKSLLYFMEIIAEEGVADLIDKPVLGQTGSPLYADVAKLTNNENEFASEYLKKIDTLLLKSAKDQYVPFNFRDYSKNGGHIPGRYMAKCIQQAGLLPDCIKNEGEPLRFFELYQQAVQKLGLSSGFSEASILYLQRVYGR